MLVVGYQGDWNAEALSELIRCSVPYCRYFLLMVVQGREQDANTIVRELEPYLVTRRLVNAWPGTISLAGKPHEMLKCELNQCTEDILVGSILSETFRPQPAVEDISLLRADGRPFLATITHEHDAFFSLDADELAVITAALEPDSLAHQGEVPTPEDRY